MFKAPSEAGLPHLTTLIDDIGHSPEKLARHLGVSLATLKRWQRTGNAPRPAMLALFWESKYGASHTHADIFNDARRHAQHAALLTGLVHRLERKIDRLEIELDILTRAKTDRFTAANSPIWKESFPRERGKIRSSV